MKIKNNITKLFLLIAVIFASSCETIDLDQTEDPSAVPERLLDPVFVFNYVQLQLPDFVNSANSFTQRVTRQMAMTGGNTYENAFAPVNFNDNWNTGYRMLNAIKIMEPNAVKNNQNYILGASKVIRAYVLVTMTDMYGDIPLTEALQGNGNLTPKFDSGVSVYKAELAELDEAIEILNRPTSNNDRVQDLYYTAAGDWIRLANTLKFKMYVTARLAGADLGIDIAQSINDVLSKDIIDLTAEDFAFQYGNSRFSPNARHPLYNDQYELGGGAYIANYYMWAMSTEKSLPMDASGTQPFTYEDNPFPIDDKFVNDPRTNFYFFKQDASPQGEDDFTLPGRSRPGHYDDPLYNSFYFSDIRTPYTVSNWVGQSAIPANGYWGRDHGDNSGIPPDATKRTVGGLYPIGGAYGIPGSVQTSGDKGALGAGIMPIILSSYVNFLKAEAMLTAGVPGDAKQTLLTAIAQSIDKATASKNNYPIIATDDRPYPTYPEGRYAPGTVIINPGTGTTNSAFLDNYSSYGKIHIRDRNNYLQFISENYDNRSQSGKLELIVKEYYLAAWGNGIEPYNNYRRTGYPSNFQPTLEPTSGAYFYKALYPGESINNNPNAPANNRTKRVFWDKASITLH